MHIGKQLLKTPLCQALDFSDPAQGAREPGAESRFQAQSSLIGSAARGRPPPSLNLRLQPGRAAEEGEEGMARLDRLQPIPRASVQRALQRSGTWAGVPGPPKA